MKPGAGEFYAFMNIYEVISWGSNGDGNAEDTIYLVRAPDFKVAIQLLENVSPADMVYEIGRDLNEAVSSDPCVLRGPYFAFAYNYGWRSWERTLDDGGHIEEWREQNPTGAQSQ